MSDEKYGHRLRKLQIDLVKTQIKAMAGGNKAIIIFEGRDAAGKDGVIKRVIQHLSPRNTRAVALPKPSDRDQGQWYFQRYVHYLPTSGEWVLFNRSWYNRGGVEPVMGFCTPAQHEQFLTDTPAFEHMLVESGATLIKYWLDVSRDEQAKRLEERRTDPLKKLKTGPIDIEAQKRFDDYTKARDEMLMRTHTPVAPWVCVRSDNKKDARLNVIAHLLQTLGGGGKKFEALDPSVIFTFHPDTLTDGRLAR